MRFSMAVQKEIQWLSAETRIKAAEMKRKEDQECCVRRQQSFWSEFIFFGKTFIHAKGFERACGIWERKKKWKRRRGRKRKRMSYETLARVTLPFTLHPAHPRLFFESPFSRSTAFSQDFVFSEELRMVYQKRSHILVKTKISILLSKRL